MEEPQLPRGYEPTDVEAKWRKHWDDSQCFKADPAAEGEAFSIVIPPPNVTGSLHIGHALNLTIQDILCRYARQQGKNVVWVPGADHAGIATQNVVERQLATEGKTRHDLGREAFVERIWQWKQEFGGKIQKQIWSMGASVDWSRERFTMDEGLSNAVRKVFVTLYNDGLIYKGDYIVNWCSRCHTALSDDEAEHETRTDKIWQIQYNLVDGSGSVIVATTRPETLFGDSAVCVHPDDERYKDIVGKMVRLPLTDKEIPVIADSYIDMEFGTGALKVTPSHDQNDWLLGKKHALEFVSVITEDGLMNEHAGRYVGITKEECRKQVVIALKEQGLLIQEEDLEHSVGHCYRCHTVIEPLVSTQWFVATTKMAAQARAAVPANTQIFPETWNKTYYNWLDSIRDWCVSRQIWWGHRIPAWTCEDCGELLVAVDAPVQCKCGSTRLTQDEDVLDTWFSSSLWPFSTMGWPDQTAELARYYPTSVLVTAFDILFFWVARMVMMGQHIMKQEPFRHVYIHALVRDAEGKKMSKSTGNVIDPLVMIDKFGTDALRFTLTVSAALGRDIRLSEDKIEGNRHFINKLWNAARFALMNLPKTPPKAFDLASLGADDLHHKWILHRLEDVKQSNTVAIATYRFNDVAQGLYKFLWNEFCDWYLELIKPDMQAGGERQERAQYVLWLVLQEIVTLLHPIIPFVTSEIFAALPGFANENLAEKLYPVARPECIAPAEAATMELVQGVIIAIRTIRAELTIAPSLKITALIRPANAEDAAVLASCQEVIMLLARLEKISIDTNIVTPKAAASAVVAGNEVVVPLSGTVDFEAELARITKEIAKITKELESIEGRLANKNFIERAPADIVEKEKAQALELQDSSKKLLALAEQFKAAKDGAE